ncbi:tRNA lysidine(34) synthetase TilS [Cellulomonas sp. Leaf395]|uniref:tRNA lysidine(34) synthetase TilS n=1 Tax=Cellulomonas sp. Leaf395 TaxID=1736362 RepID=UPI0006FDE4A1|nr:tRNA lysidine(34) synthetase TilS [Cellulomonas sp. Leaf395]KQT02159.1 tRNA(Ile)-lysidine synthetase [Cellulomonas sp. Leaf395]
MNAPAREVAAVRSAVTATVADLPADALVLVACSGGPDSLALAAGAAFVAQRSTRTGTPWRAHAVVVDHGLQEGSAQVADDAATVCRGLGLPAVVVAVEVDGRGESAARDARYAALDQVADELGAAVVLLGHTLDDQAETVLLGLARGSGARALSGMPAIRGRFRRPLLGLRRADTLAACAALHLRPWHDPTNDGSHADASLRSRVRDDALPTLERVLGPGVAEALARSAAQLRDDADLLDALAEDLLAAARTADGLDVDTLHTAPPALRSRALRSAAIAAGCPAGSLRRTHVLAVDALVTDWHGQGPVALPGGVAAVRACGRLALGPAPA